jgi:hypothetical protein
MPITYPLDLTGNDPANLVTGELHSVSEAHYQDYYFIVPNFAPFYIDNFSAEITINNVTTPLVEDVDYSFALEYVTGTRVTGKLMYGAITLHNLNLNGILSITYQTVGGDQVVDRLTVLSFLADKAYNPRTTIWDIITDVPNAFPPTPHYQDYDQFYGQEEVVTKLGEIVDAIAANSSLTQQEIQTFFNSINNGTFGAYIKRAGDVMDGFLTLHADPIDNYHAATKQYVDVVAQTAASVSSKVDRAGDTMTGPLTLSGNPTANLHATPKQYVDTQDTNLQNQIDTLQTDLTNTINQSATTVYVDERMNELYAALLSRVLAV